MMRIVLLTASLCLVSAPSFAADPSRKEDEYSYIFKEDLLSALGNDAKGTTIHVHPRPIRGTLIRPRTQFVVELLKSAEQF